MHPTGVFLGRGSFGDVIEVEYKGKVYAAKNNRSGDSKKFSRDIEILSRLKHPNIVAFYGICKLTGKTEQKTVIVMEKMTNTLSTVLYKSLDMKLHNKFSILLDVVRGLRYLHSQKPAIIHRDLTAENILLDRSNKAKISDFGNSCSISLRESTELLTSLPGTLDYLAPEALEGGEYDEKIDIFAFGHLSIYVISQQRPHPLLRHSYLSAGKLIARNEVERRANYLDNLQNKIDKEFYSLITRCLQELPSERPSCNDIMPLIGSFFTGMCMLKPGSFHAKLLTVTVSLLHKYLYL